MDKIQFLQLTCRLRRNFQIIHVHKIGTFTGGGYCEMLGPAGIGDSEGSGTFLGKGPRDIFLFRVTYCTLTRNKWSAGAAKISSLSAQKCEQMSWWWPLRTHPHVFISCLDLSTLRVHSFLPSVLHSFIPSPFLKPSRGHFNLEISTSTIGRNGALRHPNTSRNPSLLGWVFPFNLPGTHCQQRALMQDGSQRRGLDWDLAYRSSGITAERFPKDRG